MIGERLIKSLTNIREITNKYTEEAKESRQITSALGERADSIASTVNEL